MLWYDQLERKKFIIKQREALQLTSFIEGMRVYIHRGRIVAINDRDELIPICSDEEDAAFQRQVEKGVFEYLGNNRHQDDPTKEYRVYSWAGPQKDDLREHDEGSK